MEDSVLYGPTCREYGGNDLIAIQISGIELLTTRRKLGKMVRVSPYQGPFLMMWQRFELSCNKVATHSEFKSWSTELTIMQLEGSWNASSETGMKSGSAIGPLDIIIFLRKHAGGIIRCCNTYQRRPEKVRQRVVSRVSWTRHTPIPSPALTRPATSIENLTLEA